MLAILVDDDDDFFRGWRSQINFLYWPFNSAGGAKEEAKPKLGRRIARLVLHNLWLRRPQT